MSTSTVGKLRVALGLDTAEFKRNAQGVGPTLAQMRNRFMAASGAVVGYGGALTAYALRGAQAIDQTAKAARRLDGTVAGYRAVEMAADDAGANIASLADDIQTMNRSIAGNSTGAQTALAALGLTAAGLSQLDVDEKMAAIADRIHDLGLNSADASVLLQQLGIRNREMVLLMVQGGDALRGARQDVQDFGLALSDVDAAAIERANDQLAGLADISQYVGDQLALKLVPGLGNLAEGLTDSLREGGALRALLDFLVGNIEVTGAALGALTIGLGVRYVGAAVSARAATAGMSSAMYVLRGAIASTGIGLLVVGVGALGAAMLSAGGNTDTASAALNSAESAAADLSIELDMLAQQDLPNASAGTVKLANDNLALARSAYAAAQAQVELAKATQQAAFTQSSMEDAFLPGVENPGQAAYEAANAGLMASVEHLKNAEAELNARILEGNTIKNEAAEIITNVRREVTGLEGEISGRGSAEGLSPAMKELDDTIEDVDTTAQQWADNMSGHFDGLITGGKGLSGVLNSMARQLESRGWQQLFSGLAGGGGGTGIAGFFSSIASTFGGARADGGPVSLGRTYLVGERGPELFTPGASGQITSNENMRGVTGAGGIATLRIIAPEGFTAQQQGQIEGIAVQVVNTKTPKMIKGSIAAGREGRVFG